MGAWRHISYSYPKPVLFFFSELWSYKKSDSLNSLKSPQIVVHVRVDSCFWDFICIINATKITTLPLPLHLGASFIHVTIE